MIFYFKQVAGLIQWQNQRALFDWLLSHGDYKGSYVVEIKKEKGVRSLSQNDFYWLFLNQIEKETGNISTDLHALFKRKFLPPIPKSILGVEFKVPASTTTLSKAEFSDYMDKISAFTEIPIPEPIKKEFDIQSVHEGLEKPIGEVKF